MKELTRITVFLIWVVHSGCSYLVPKSAPVAEKEPEGPPSSVKYDLRTLSLYSGYIAGLSAPQRVTECEKLIHGEAGDTGSMGVRLHTALIMQVTPECGGPEKAMVIFDGARSRLAENRSLSGFLAYLSRLSGVLVEERQKYRVDKEEMEKVVNRNTRLKNQLAEKGAELKQLEATLDALKRIEKTFHQRN